MPNDTSTQPSLVTVYLPTCNRLPLLRRAIDSVLQQTYSRLELIVVDDCSSDDTPEFLQDLVTRDARVRMLRNQRNSGACASRNAAIATATGKYITGMDDDDYFPTQPPADFHNHLAHARRRHSGALLSAEPALTGEYRQSRARPAKD